MDQETTDMIMKASIYPMMFLDITDDIVYNQMYIAYGILALSICTILIVNVKCPNIDIIFLLKLLLTIIS